MRFKLYFLSLLVLIVMCPLCSYGYGTGVRADENTLGRIRRAYDHKARSVWPRISQCKAVLGAEETVRRYAEEGSAEAAIELHYLYEQTNHNQDTLAMIEGLLNEAAEKYNSPALADEAALMRIIYRLDISSDEVYKRPEILAGIIERAKKSGNATLYWRARINSLVKGVARVSDPDIVRMYDELQALDDSVFPLKDHELFTYAKRLSYNLENDEALRVFRRIASKAPSSYYDDIHIRALAELGAIYFKRGDIRRSTDCFIRILENTYPVAGETIYDMTAISHLWFYLVETCATEHIGGLFAYDFSHIRFVDTCRPEPFSDVHLRQPFICTYGIMRDYLALPAGDPEPPFDEAAFDPEKMFEKYAREGVNSCLDELFYFEKYYYPALGDEEKAAEIEKLEAVAARHKSSELRNRAELMRIDLSVPQFDINVDKEVGALEDFVERMAEEGDIVMQLRGMEKLITTCYEISSVLKFRIVTWSQNTFRYARRMIKLLDETDDSVYPYRSSDYFILGRLYYLFEDKNRALSLFGKSAECRNCSYYDASKTESIIMLSFLLPEDETMMRVWDVVRDTEPANDKTYLIRKAMCALGIEFANSINNTHIGYALLKTFMPDMVERKDYELAWRAAAAMARLYMAGGNIEMTGRMIDLAIGYNNDASSAHDYRFNLLLSRYYIATGRMRELNILLGDEMMYNEQRNEMTMGVIRDAEQELYETEIHEKNVQLQSQGTWLIFILVVGTAVFLIAVVFLRLYRKKCGLQDACAQGCGVGQPGAVRFNDGGVP